MISLNSLFKNDFSRSDSGTLGSRFGTGESDVTARLNVPQPPLPPATGNASNIEQILVQAYQKLQVTVADGLPATDSAVNAPADTDFSPAAVTDRILGFITDRLETARAEGASDEEVQELYQQALKGVEQGMREARDIIDQQGLFSGEVKDNFYATVTQLADGLEALGEKLTGVDLDSAPSVIEPSAVGPSASATSVQFERNRSIELEVVTQDGDTIKLLVQSGQSGYADEAGSNFSAGLTTYDNIAFSVEGDLDEGEMAALRDLMGQVNTVAESFFNGNVEQAFDQAMSVGMDAEELASFSADLNQSSAVAIQQSYGSVAALGQNPSFDSGANVLPRLGDFAQSVQAAAEQVGELDSGGLPAVEVLRELISRFYDSDTQAAGGEGNMPSATDNSAEFRRFIEALA